MNEDLLEAAKTGDLEQIIYLVKEVGLPVDSQYPPEGPTPLYWAACNGNVNVCSWLVDHQADPNFTLHKSGSTPLHAAADRGHYSCVLLLICRGANINQQTSNNWDTALHLAAYRGYPSICSLLLDHGADVFRQNKQRRTPLDEAYITSKVDIVQMICKKQAEFVNSKKFLTKSGCSECVQSTSRMEIKKTKDVHHGFSQASQQSIDFDDRIGIQQFDKKIFHKPPKAEAIQSFQSKTVVPQTSYYTKEKSDVSKTFAAFHSSLVDELARLKNSVEERDRQLLQLRKENEKLQSELRTYKP